MRYFVMIFILFFIVTMATAPPDENEYDPDATEEFLIAIGVNTTSILENYENKTEEEPPTSESLNKSISRLDYQNSKCTCEQEKKRKNNAEIDNKLCYKTLFVGFAGGALSATIVFVMISMKRAESALRTSLMALSKKILSLNEELSTFRDKFVECARVFNGIGNNSVEDKVKKLEDLQNIINFEYVPWRHNGKGKITFGLMAAATFLLAVLQFNAQNTSTSLIANFSSGLLSTGIAGCSAAAVDVCKWLTQNSKRNYRKKVLFFLSCSLATMVVCSFYFTEEILQDYLDSLGAKKIPNGDNLNNWYQFTLNGTEAKTVVEQMKVYNFGCILAEILSSELGASAIAVNSLVLLVSVFVVSSWVTYFPYNHPHLIGLLFLILSGSSVCASLFLPTPTKPKRHGAPLQSVEIEMMQIKGVAEEESEVGDPVAEELLSRANHPRSASSISSGNEGDIDGSD